MQLRLDNGQASFDSEKQNEPIDPASCTFREADFRFWDDQFDSEEQLFASIGGDNVRVIGACDPSIGKAGRSRDDSAIITLLHDLSTGILYVLDADIRKRSPDQIIRDIIDYHARRDYDIFVVETVQFQEFLAQELVKRSRLEGLEVPVEKVTPVKDKMGRIQSLQPKVSYGGIRFCRRHRLLMDQLRQFPKAAHDDGPDALEMAVSSTVQRQRPTITFGRMVPIQPGSRTRTWVPESEEEEQSLQEILQDRFRDFLGA